MMLKISVVVAAVFVLAGEVLSQGQQKPQPYAYSSMSAQMWDPSAWSSPYGAAGSNMWMDYIKKAAEASQKLYKQWDKTGAASNMIAAGMGYAQQWAAEAQKAAEAAMKQAQGTAYGAFN